MTCLNKIGVPQPANIGWKLAPSLLHEDIASKRPNFAGKLVHEASMGVMVLYLATLNLKRA